MKLKRIAVFMLGILLMIFCGFSFKKSDRTWKTWLKGEQQQYYGNINIWHIKDGYFVRLPIENMLKKFEKNNFGIFINVCFLSADEAKEKIINGEYPDLVIYSQSFFDSPEDELLELEKIDSPFLDAGKTDSKILAYPLCYDTYSVIVNDEIFDEAEEELTGVITPDDIVNNMIKFSFKEGVKPISFCSGGGVLSFLKAARGDMGKVNFETGQLNDFAKGKTAVFVCGSNELEHYAVELPSNSEYKFGGYTDRAMFLSVYNCGDKNKIKYAKEVAGALMSENLQNKIDGYAFSGLKCVDEGIYIGNAFKQRPDDETIKSLINENRGGLLEMID